MSRSIIEAHLQGRWVQAAELQAFDEERCRFDYLADYVFSEAPLPVALEMPVRFTVDAVAPDGQPDRRPPAFLYDLVPQGRGRRHLVELLKLADSDRLVMPLLMNGAFNPIGNLRLSSAVEFYRNQARLNPERARPEGFGLDDIQAKSEDFLQHLALHAMLASGTTGVQGVAPKYLLTQDRDERWYADLAIDDSRATRHWLVKLPRGRSDEDLLVHRNEAAYLRVASACGLRVHHEAMMVGRMLFVRRFDRDVENGVVVRHSQESLASLAGLRGFGVPTTQNQLLAALRRHVTDPAAETLEFLKRDVLNLALRNTDNHARNTAVQRLSDGKVQLTPVFDFAPMYLDPEVVPRSVHWRDSQGARLDTWTQVIESLGLSGDELSKVLTGLRDFSETVGRLPETVRGCGVDDVVTEGCRSSIDDQAAQLAALPKPSRSVKLARASKGMRRG